jgi:hypothetical protein
MIYRGQNTPFKICIFEQIDRVFLSSLVASLMAYPDLRCKADARNERHAALATSHTEVDSTAALRISSPLLTAGLRIVTVTRFLCLNRGIRPGLASSRTSVFQRNDGGAYSLNQTFQCIVAFPPVFIGRDSPPQLVELSAGSLRDNRSGLRVAESA